MLGNTGDMLRGDGDADSLFDDIARKDDTQKDLELQEKRRLEREANAKRHREAME